MEQGIVGRPVRKNDYLQIAKLRMIGEAYRDTSGVMVDERPVFRSKSRRSLVRESARIYREMHSRPESSFMLLTFVIDGQIVGFLEGSCYGRLYAIVVHPEHRRLGIATRLFHRYSEQVERIRYEVDDLSRRTSPWAVEFLRSVGFRLVRKRGTSKIHFRR